MRLTLPSIKTTFTIEMRVIDRKIYPNPDGKNTT